MIDDVREAIPSPVGDVLSARLRAVIDAVADAITVQDPHGRLVYANDAAARLIGFDDPEELLAADPRDVLARFEMFDEDGSTLSPAALPGRLALLGATPAPRTIRFFVRATGEERWSIVRATPLRDADGSVSHAINAFQDITPQVRAEHDARASERRYRRLVEALPIVAWVTDPDGRLIAANTRWAELTGSEPRLGLSLDRLLPVHDEDGPPLVERWRRAVRAGDRFDATVRLRRHDGVLRWHQLQARPLLDDDGAVEGWVGTSTDVDTSVRAEERSRIVAEAAARLDESLDLEATVRAAAEITVPSFADWCVVDLVTAGGGIRRAAIRVGDASRSAVAGGLADYPSMPGTNGLMGQAIATGRARLVEAVDDAMLRRVTADERHREILRALDTRSAIVVPLPARGRILGAMALVRGSSGRGFTADDVPLAEELGRRAGLALANAELYEGETGARREAEMAAARTQRLQQLTGALAAARTRSEVGRVVVRHARAAFGASGGAVYVLDQTGSGLEALAMSGYPAAHARRWRRVGLDVDLLLTAAIRGDADHWAPDLAVRAALPHVGRAIEVTGDHAAAALVLRVKGRAVGGIALSFREPRPFATEERELGRTIADLADQALERVSLAEAREALLADVERQRGRLTAVLEQLPVGVVIAEAPSGAILLANSQVEGLLGTSLEEGRSLLTLDVAISEVDGRPVPAEERPLARAILAAERTENRELEVVRPDGARLTLLASAAPILDRDERTVAGVVVLSDITERRAAHERERYLAEASRVLGESLDYETTLTRVARLAVPRVADWCSIDLIGEAGVPDRLVVAHVDPAKVELAREMRERFPPDPDAATGVAAVLRTGRSELVAAVPPEIIENAPLPEDYKAIIRTLQLRSYMCVPLLAGGQTLGAITFVGAESGRRFGPDDLVFAEALAARAAASIENARLYGERVAAQERLERLAAAEHARAAELDAVIRTMGEGIFVCDVDGRVILSNPAARALSDDRAPATYAELLATLQDPTSIAPRLGERGGPVELRTVGDAERWRELATYPVGGRAAEGETIVVLRDITSARQRELVRDTFVGVLSHELRTPVTTIYGGSKLLSRGGLSEERRQAIVDDMSAEAERLQRLVEDVIALNRFGEAQGDIGQEPVLLQRILPPMVAAERARWPSVTFDVRVPPGLPTVVADPTYVEQVVRNLLSNAAKYGGPGATVEARIEAVGDEVIVRILDDGPGFPPDEAERLFELFYRSASTAGTAAGAGIGLFVSARLIHAMGGRIWAQPRPARGAEFGFALKVMADD